MSINSLRRATLQGLLVLASQPLWPAVSGSAEGGAAAAGSADEQLGLRLRRLIADSEAANALLDPLPRATVPAGSPAFVDPLADGTLQRQLAQARADLQTLEGIDRNRLGPTEQIARDVLSFSASEIVRRHESGLVQLALAAPLDSMSGLHVELPDYVSGAGAPFNTAEDYQRGLERLQGFAQHLESVRQRASAALDQGYRQPAVTTAKVLAQLQAMLALPAAESPLLACTRRFPTDLDAATRATLERQYQTMVNEQVLPAYARLAEFLKTRYLPQALEAPGRWALKDGDRLYTDELKYHTTVAVTAEELHRTGQQEVARYLEGMREVVSRVGFKGSLAEFFEFIRRDPQFYYTRPEDLLARFREIEAQIWRGMPALFARRPKAPFAVRALPAIGGQRGTGYYRPGPPDGKTEGVLWFNMAMLKTRPIPTLETLTIHEGIPGHHYQITLVLEDARLPDNLRFGSHTAYSEGWGLYAESLGPELGMFNDPYQYFGHLDMAMLRAVRLVVDTGLHALRWSRSQAIDYMLANTSMARYDVEVEIDRYITKPGQACAYKTGELRIRALREAAQRERGAAFDLREFHSQVLDTGALPLEVLERKVRGWMRA
ncbi:MAG: hypothetical protein RL580_2043 [Pseudomonadota bacterium]